MYDPAGKNPIPHAFVFVPADPAGKIPAITPGAHTCDTCNVPIGSYVAATMSDATGSFSLHGVPTGTQVPLVVQIGKWRREVFVSTTSCQNTVLPASDTRLPSSQAQGDMPAMALLTGGLDDLGCLLFRWGLRPENTRALKQAAGSMFTRASVRRAAAPDSRAGPQGTARTRAAPSGLRKPASSRTTSCSSRAKALSSTRRSMQAAASWAVGAPTSPPEQTSHA